MFTATLGCDHLSGAVFGKLLGVSLAGVIVLKSGHRMTLYFKLIICFPLLLFCLSYSRGIISYAAIPGTCSFYVCVVSVHRAPQAGSPD